MRVPVRFPVSIPHNRGLGAFISALHLQILRLRCIFRTRGTYQGSCGWFSEPGL